MREYVKLTNVGEMPTKSGMVYDVLWLFNVVPMYPYPFEIIFLQYDVYVTVKVVCLK